MADISNIIASRMKDVFTFFKLSPELRNRIFRALSEDHRTDASFGTHDPALAKQFRDEYTAEVYRHLGLKLVMVTLILADQEEDYCFAQALLRHTPTVPLLDHMKTFTLAIGVRKVWLPADELDGTQQPVRRPSYHSTETQPGDPDFLTIKLHALLHTLPTL
ncbi:hypothetical protein LTR95_003571 [Oleoguttula sp. CCFEE 5521]